MRWDFWKIFEHGFSRTPNIRSRMIAILGKVDDRTFNVSRAPFGSGLATRQRMHGFEWGIKGLGTYDRSGFSPTPSASICHIKTIPTIDKPYRLILLNSFTVLLSFNACLVFCWE